MNRRYFSTAFSMTALLPFVLISACNTAPEDDTVETNTEVAVGELSVGCSDTPRDILVRFRVQETKELGEAKLTYRSSTSYGLEYRVNGELLGTITKDNNVDRPHITEAGKRRANDPRVFKALFSAFQSRQVFASLTHCSSAVVTVKAGTSADIDGCWVGGLLGDIGCWGAAGLGCALSIPTGVGCAVAGGLGAACSRFVGVLEADCRS
jgi:hypothetical protein